MQPLTLNADARILISRPDRVGDVIISTSCFAPVRKIFPRGELYFLGAERMRPLLENHPELTGFISHPKDIARVAPDVVVHLHPDEKVYSEAKRAGVPIRIGYRQKSLSKYLTHALDDRRLGGVKHEADYNFDLLRLIGVSPPARLETKVYLPKAALGSLRAKLPWELESTKFAVLNPTAHSPVARWPRDYFLRLAEKLQSEHGLVPVFVGAGDDDIGDDRFLNLAGKTDLGELGWLLKHTRVLVTRDTGPSHLAAAVGCPVVVIFGRTAPLYGPTRWRPLTDKAVIVTKPIPRKRWEPQTKYWRRSFAAISVEEVEASVRQALTAWPR